MSDRVRDLFVSWPLVGGAAHWSLRFATGLAGDMGEQMELRELELPPNGIFEIER